MYFICIEPTYALQCINFAIQTLKTLVFKNLSAMDWQTKATSRYQHPNICYIHYFGLLSPRLLPTALIYHPLKIDDLTIMVGSVNREHRGAVMIPISDFFDNKLCGAFISVYLEFSLAYLNFSSLRKLII